MCSCGVLSHDGAYVGPMKCINCEGDHAATSKTCPSYINEIAIQKLKVVEKIPYAEAKRKVRINTPRPNLTYASASKSDDRVEGIMAKVLPQLQVMIKETIATCLNTSTETAFLRPRSDSTSTNISVGSGIFKRTQSQVDTTSDEDNLNSTIPKKKKGWPKGLKRKPPL